MTGWWRIGYMIMGWEYPEKYRPSEKTLRARHLLLKQIKESKIKLKPVCFDVLPSYIKFTVSDTYSD